MQMLSPQLSQKTLKIDPKKDQRQQVIKYFEQTYALYEKLYELIKDEQSYYVKSEPLRHPLIFYLGHTSTFFINKFLDAGIINKRVNEKFEFMFAVGVDQMDWDDLNDSHYDWPSVKDTLEYRKQVKKVVIQAIRKMNKKITWDSDLWIVLMGIQHQRIHLETSSVIIRRLPIDKINPVADFVECPQGKNQVSTIPHNGMVSLEAFKHQWVRNRESAQTYGWDNQFGTYKINLKPFEASQMLVSNGQYLQFVQEGGYQKQQYWTEQGKNWIKATRTKRPLFWGESGGGKFTLRTLQAVRQMPWDWPAEVNNLEAQAFCRWKSKKTGKGYRLPTESEYLAIRNELPTDQTNWEYRSVGNINLEYWFSPNPVNKFKSGRFYDVVGNVWQHTATPIYPFQGFEIHPVYEDFTTPTFDQRHNLIKGGSFISTGNQSLYHARYAFRRHFYQFAGFRYVLSENSTEISGHFEDQTDEKVEQALKDHYVHESSYINFAQQKIMNLLGSQLCNRALSVGCSVGRIPFELAKKFKQSFGIDYTARFFQMATRLCQSGQINYKDVHVNFDKLNFKKNSVTLYQFNPQNPDPKKLSTFDFIYIDGNALRAGTLMNVLKKAETLISRQKCKIAVVSVKGKNELIKDEVKNFEFKWNEVQEDSFENPEQTDMKETKLTFFEVTS